MRFKCHSKSDYKLKFSIVDACLGPLSGGTNIFDCHSGYSRGVWASRPLLDFQVFSGWSDRESTCSRGGRPLKWSAISVCLSHLYKIMTTFQSSQEQQILVINKIAFVKYFNDVSQQSITSATWWRWIKHFQQKQITPYQDNSII